MPESPPEPPEGAPVPPWVGAGSVAHAALSAVVRAVISREQMPMSDVILKGAALLFATVGQQLFVCYGQPSTLLLRLAVLMHYNTLTL